MVTTHSAFISRWSWCCHATVASTLARERRATQKLVNFQYITWRRRVIWRLLLRLTLPHDQLVFVCFRNVLGKYICYVKLRQVCRRKFTLRLHWENTKKSEKQSILARLFSTVSSSLRGEETTGKFDNATEYLFDVVQIVVVYCSAPYQVLYIWNVRANIGRAADSLQSDKINSTIWWNE